MHQYLIVCPLVFLAGFVDSIAGGGGLISLPAYLAAGVPPHLALGTNKMGSTMGTVISTARFAKSGYIKWKLSLFAAACAIVGSIIGSNLSLLASEQFLKGMMLFALPVVAFYVLKNKDMGDNKNTGSLTEKQMMLISMAAALVIGTYDGFYGPGTGTFLLLVLTGAAKMDLRTASGTTKVINLSSNIAALVTFLINGKVLLPLGITAGVFCIAGHYIGSGMVVKSGQKVVRPVVLAVLLCLFVKIVKGSGIAMKWKKFTLKTTTQAVDLVSSMFDEIGIEGIEIEDNIPLTAEETKGMFIDILPELPPDEGVAFVSFYLDDSQDIAGILKSVDEGLDDLSMFTDLGERTITESETEDKDWINNWKQYFKPFTVDDILIKPTWEEIPEEHKDKLLIQIDPGPAFGTGQHETTQLCIRQLRKYVTPETVLLDVGTGSGILGITALKLGAKAVFGTDLDENAITAVGENLEANGIDSEKFAVLQGNIIDDKDVQDAAGYEKYDVAVANILADVIILLQKEVPVHLKKGGIFITSGIINMKEEAVRAAFAANDAFEVIEVTYQGEWLSVTARKK